MLRGKEVEFIRDGITIEDISTGIHTPIGIVGLNLLQRNFDFSSLLKKYNNIGLNLTKDQKRAALWARAKGLVEQNPPRHR